VTDVSQDDLPILRISPSMYSRLAACQYRVFLDRRRRVSSATSPVSAASILGTAGHLALESLVETGAMHVEDLAGPAAAAWEEAISEVAGSLALATKLSGYYLKAARFANTAARLQHLVRDAFALEPEVELRSADGFVVGRADLIAHGGFGTWIIDYKSGVEREAGTGKALIHEHENQLRLYSYLWANSHGDWPTTTYLLPFDGPEIEVAVDPPACEEVAKEVRRLVGEYNDALPEPPPAVPSPDTCRYCAHVGECGPFRSACDVTWAPDLMALRGIVVATERSARGGRSLLIDVDGGSIAPGRVAVTHIADTIRDADRAVPGSRVVIVGLYVGPTDAVFGLRESGSVSVVSPMV
jgi:CRISPR/Cas system-associated exonuclease Cas4 (RecB family)